MKLTFKNILVKKINEMSENEVDQYLSGMSEQNIRYLENVLLESREYNGYVYDYVGDYFDLIKKTDWYDITKDFQSDEEIQDNYFTYVNDILIIVENPKDLEVLVPILIQFKEQLDSNDNDWIMKMDTTVDSLQQKYSFGYDIYNDTKTQGQLQVGKEIEKQLT